MRKAHAWAVIATLASALGVSAQTIYKCIDARGSVTLQDFACVATETRPIKPALSSDKKAGVAAAAKPIRVAASRPRPWRETLNDLVYVASGFSAKLEQFPHTKLNNLPELSAALDAHIEDISEVNVPACLANVRGLLRTSMRTAKQAVDLVKTGANINGATVVGQLLAASVYVNQARTAIKAQPCEP